MIRCKTIRGSIWKSGRNYVTSLDTKFAEKIKKEYNLEVEKTIIEDKIIINPPYDPTKRKSLEITVDPNDFAEIKMKIVSAYLEGYDNVNISTASPFPKEIIEKLNLIPYVKIEFTSPERYRILFFELYDISLKEVLRDVEGTLKALSDKTQEIFKAFPDSSSMKNTIFYITNLETKLDSLTYQVRRYLNKALCYGELYEKLGLRNDKDIIHLTSIFGYFERLGDLHREIGERLEKISKNKNLDLSTFLFYYNHASETVPIAVEALNNPWEGLEVIRGKLSMWKLYKDGILGSDKESVKNVISVQKDPKLVRDLVILEGKIRAIPDVSSNICELAWNMNREALKELKLPYDVESLSHPHRSNECRLFYFSE